MSQESRKYSFFPASLLAFLLLFPIKVAAQGLSISGTVTDASTGEPLIGVNIYTSSGRYGTISDLEGCYSFTVPRGRAEELRASFVGYEISKRSVPSQGSIRWDIRMKRTENSLDEVEVYGSRDAFGIHDAQLSVQRLSAEQITSMPSLFGEADVLKSVQKLPGIMPVADGNAGIMVRGGNYDQNEILLDGMPLYSTEHLRGFVSAINPDVTETVDVFKGAFPARYGSRLSSVVDIRQKDGNMESYHGALNLGMLSSRLYAEGPLAKGKTSFAVAGRLSYLDAIVQPVFEKIADGKNSLGIYSRMDYYDLNARLVHRFSSRDRLSAVFYLGRDWDSNSPTASSQEMSEPQQDDLIYDTTKGKKNSVDNHWGNLAARVLWTHSLASGLSLSSAVSYSRFNSQMHMSSDTYSRLDRRTGLTGQPQMQEESHTVSDIRYNSGIADLTGRADLLWDKLENHKVRVGTLVTLQKFSPYVDLYSHKVFTRLMQVSATEEELRTTDTVTDSRSGRTDRELTASVYAEDQWEPFSQLSVLAGVRLSLYSITGATRFQLEPRLSLRYLLTQNLSLKVGYAHMSQGISLLSSNNLVMPSDLWVPVTSSLDLATSDQVSVGVMHRVGKSMSISLEGYWKKMNGLLEYQEGTSFMNATSEWEKMVSQGSGRSYGAELMVRKLTGRTTGWLSYTYARSLRTFDRPGMEIAGGREFLASTDRPHTVNLMLTQQIGRHWDISACWSYQSGRRGTLSTTALYGGLPNEYNQYDNGSHPIRYINRATQANPNRYDRYDEVYTYLRTFALLTTYSERNSYTLPATHHLDLSLSYHIQHGKWESICNLSVYNVYNRQNVSSVYVGYENNLMVLKGVCMFPVLPSLNYTLRF